MSALMVRRACFLLFIVCSILLAAVDAQAQVERFVAGEHYTVLPDTTELRPLQGVAGKPAVTEIFWYGCPHCYAFDPLLESWVQQQGDAMTFSRTPAIWDAMTRHHAQVFYAEQALEVSGELHKPIFDSIHQRHDYLTDEKAVAELFAQHGVPAEKFAAAFNSFSMDSTLRKTTAMVAKLQVPSVPAMVVNGKYLVHVHDSVPTHEKMLEVVEFLMHK